MELKVGDIVKLKNRRGENWNFAGKMDCYMGKTVTIHEIDKSNKLFKIKEDETLCRNSFPIWVFRFNDIERVINSKTHFKSLPSDYTGTLEIENGFIKEILDEKEKEYLSYVIRPFRDDVKHILKLDVFAGEEYIFINTSTGNCYLPFFKKGTMYKGMEINKKYTLKELGLDV